MTAAPRRRWFRFGLRTMFVVFTVICALVGYSLNWIRERHAFLEETYNPNNGLIVQVDPDEHITKAPWPLRVFGERAVALVWTLNKLTDVADGERAKRLFPEARVRVRSTSPGTCHAMSDGYVPVAEISGKFSASTINAVDILTQNGINCYSSATGVACWVHVPPDDADAAKRILRQSKLIEKTDILGVEP